MDYIFLNLIPKKLLFTIIEYLEGLDIPKLKDVINFDWELLFRNNYESIYNLTMELAKIDPFVNYTVLDNWKLYYLNLVKLRIDYHLDKERALSWIDNLILPSYMYSSYYYFPKIYNLLTSYDKSIVNVLYSINLYNVDNKLLVIRDILINKGIDTSEALNWLYLMISPQITVMSDPNNIAKNMLTNLIYRDYKTLYENWLLENNLSLKDLMIVIFIFYDSKSTFVVTDIEIKDLLSLMQEREFTNIYDVVYRYLTKYLNSKNIY